MASKLIFSSCKYGFQNCRRRTIQSSRYFTSFQFANDVAELNKEIDTLFGNQHSSPPLQNFKANTNEAVNYHLNPLNSHSSDYTSDNHTKFYESMSSSAIQSIPTLNNNRNNELIEAQITWKDILVINIEAKSNSINVCGVPLENIITISACDCINSTFVIDKVSSSYPNAMHRGIA